MIDWNEIRKQFPVTETVAYLNSAAAGPVSRAAREAALGYYEKMMRDGDVHWNQWLAERETIRKKIAKFINAEPDEIGLDRKSTRLNSSHSSISYAVFCLKKKRSIPT